MVFNISYLYQLMLRRNTRLPKVNEPNIEPIMEEKELNTTTMKEKEPLATPDDNAGKIFSEIPVEVKFFDERFRPNQYNYTKKVELDEGIYALYTADYKPPNGSWEGFEVKLTLIGSIFFATDRTNEAVIFIKKALPERLALENKEKENIIAQVTDNVGRKKFILFAGALPHPQFLINIINNCKDFTKIDTFYKI